MIAEWGEIIAPISFCNCVWNAMCTCLRTHSSFLCGETLKFQLQWSWIHFQIGEKGSQSGAGAEILCYPIIIVPLKVLWTGMRGRVIAFIQGSPDTYWTYVGLSLNWMLGKQWQLAGQSVGDSLLLTKFFCYHHIQNLSPVHLPAHCVCCFAFHRRLWFLSILGTLKRKCWGRRV